MADSETYAPTDSTVYDSNPDATFFVPLTTPSTGTTLSSDDWPQNKTVPKLFEPIKIGNLEFKNRIFVSTTPLLLYSRSRREPY